MRTNPIRIVSIVLCTRPNRSMRLCVGRFASCCAVLIWDHNHKPIRRPFGTMFSFDKNKVSKLWILMRGSKLWLHSRSFRVAETGEIICIAHIVLSCRAPNRWIIRMPSVFHRQNSCCLFVFDFFCLIIYECLVFGQLTVGHTPQSHLTRRACWKHWLSIGKWKRRQTNK